MGAVKHEIDVKSSKELIEDLNIKKLASQDYKSSIIRSDLSAPTGNQNLISKVYEAKAREFRNNTEDKLAYNVDERSLRDMRLFQTRLSNLPKTLQDLHEANLIAKTDAVETQAKIWNRAAVNLRHFKADNDLFRDPFMPKEMRLHYGFMAFLVLVESILNSQFFAAGSQSGLIGGIIIAILLSVVNYLIATLAGVTGIRNLNHVKSNRRYMGMAGIVAWASLTLLFNLAAAHYRFNVAIDPLTAARDAVLSLWNNPLGIVDINSWWLFAAGGLFSAGFVAKHIKHEDIYPEFVRYARAVEIAEEDYSHIRDSLTTTISDYINEKMIEADDIQSDALKAHREFRALLTESKNIIQNYPENAQKIGDEFSAAIQEYRNYILNAEDKANIPAFFEEDVMLGELVVPLEYSPIKEDEDKIEPMREALREVRQQAVETKQSILDLFKPLVSSTTEFMDSIRSQVFGHSINLNIEVSGQETDSGMAVEDGQSQTS